MLPIVNKAAAHKAMTRHQLVPGIGYLQHTSDPDIPAGARGGKNTKPPAGTADGSFHMLQPGAGGPPIRLRWIGAEAAWASTVPERGNRLAWTADHLSKAGWEYVGPDTGAAPAKRKKKA